jgi:hypothetical protein
MVVHLESGGHAADGTHMKHTTKLRAVDHGQRKPRERLVWVVRWAVRAVPGYFHVHVWEKSRREKQVRATSRTVRKGLV